MNSRFPGTTIVSVPLEQFEHDGFSIVDNILDDVAVDVLLHGLESDAKRTKSRSRRVYSARNLLDDVPAVRELAADTRIRSLIGDVIGDNAFPVRALFFDKTPEANWPVAWHQDVMIPVAQKLDVPRFGPWSVKAGVPHVRPPAEILARMVTIRVHLDDCLEESGPLKVMPGTHRQGFLEDAEIQTLVEQNRATTCCVPRGGAAVMRPLILHSSSRAITPSHRRVVHIEFAAERLPCGLQWYCRP